MDNTFNEIRPKFNNKILNTRKQRFSFIKLYIIRKYEIDLDVKRMKEIMYGETKPILDYEKESLSLFNLYTHLLETKLFTTFLNKIGIDNIEIDSSNIINTVFALYNKIDLIYVFMIMNYLLICNNLPIINPYKNRYNEFIESLNNNDYSLLRDLVIDILDNTNILDIDYYDKCLETSKELIIDFINENKDLIKEEGRINNIYLFGSYALGKIRYDSDIDILVITKDDLTYEEKVEGVLFIKKLIEGRFRRIVDIHETTKELLERDNNRLEGRIKIF